MKSTVCWSWLSAGKPRRDRGSLRKAPQPSFGKSLQSFSSVLPQPIREAQQESIRFPVICFICVWANEVLVIMCTVSTCCSQWRRIEKPISKLFYYGLITTKLIYYLWIWELKTNIPWLFPKEETGMEFCVLCKHICTVCVQIYMCVFRSILKNMGIFFRV